MDFDEQALQAVRETRFLIDEYDRWILSEIKPFLGQRVLEVGCGLGNLLQYLLDRELVVGVDNSMETVLRTRDRYARNGNIQVHCYDITDPDILQLRSAGFDTVVSLNVLEHIREDRLALSHMSRLLVPSGRLILIVPAHSFLYGTMDRAIGHYRRYDKDSVAAKLRKVGFTIEQQRYLNFLGAVGWFLNGRILRRKVPPTGQLRVFNSLVPFVRLLEQWLLPPTGVSLLAIARREGAM